ncbi:MAG: helix-turn-helix transcriptional regulator [Prevotella sp.]|nr:helix-turn-helix transcriptional regulator [Prevotella sp.]
MKDRIKQLMESQHMTQQTFSDFIGISSASLSSIFNGRTKPTLNTVEAIRSKFTKISLDWLMYGTGPMFKDENQNVDAPLETPSPNNVEGMIDFGIENSAPLPLESISSNVQRGNLSSPNYIRTDVKYIDKRQRQITEIRIFFDDQTWETFVPKK